MHSITSYVLDWVFVRSERALFDLLKFETLAECKAS